VRQIQKQRLQSVAGLALVAALVGAGVGVLVSLIDEEAFAGPTLRGALIGLLIGAGLGLGEAVIFPRLSRRIGFFLLNAARVAFYGDVILVSLLLVNAADRSLTEGLSLRAAAASYLSDTGPRDIFVSGALAVLITSIFLIRRLHNPGEIRRLLLGRYHYPQKENRIFLFADLAGSTTLAESLGSQVYSSLLREMFADISDAILAWRGEVYQYAGDGVIVSWKTAAGIRDAACLRCFLDMKQLLARRSERYEAKYGAAPRLRGGVHGGDVVTTWVGEAKKELAFHGDTLNATARIQGLCKELGVDLLVSQPAIAMLSLPSDLRAEAMGEMELRGRKEPLGLLAVEGA
jgi:adenylate cyclase